MKQPWRIRNLKLLKYLHQRSVCVINIIAAARLRHLLNCHPEKYGSRGKWRMFDRSWTLVQMLIEERKQSFAAPRLLEWRWPYSRETAPSLRDRIMEGGKKQREKKGKMSYSDHLLTLKEFPFNYDYVDFRHNQKNEENVHGSSRLIGMELSL